MNVPVTEMKQRTPKEEADRKTRVRELRGKYAFTKNSSDDFARRKAEEIESEENDGGDRKK